MEYWRPPWKRRAQFRPEIHFYFQQPMTMELVVEMQGQVDALRKELDRRSIGPLPLDGVPGPTADLTQRMWDLRECAGYVRTELERNARRAEEAHRGAQRAAFAMGLHPRLGRESVLSALPRECVVEIARHQRDAPSEAAAAAAAVPRAY